MARNGSGSYSLSDTLANATTGDADEVNAILQDIADEITNSVAVDGQSTMTAPLKAANGSAAAPSYTFGSDTNTGFYRVGSDSVGLGLGGANTVTFDTDGITLASGDKFTGAWAYLPSGTKMLFVQTSAPTGWTKDTTHNDKALRVVSGSASSGGSTAFTSVFTSRTIAEANLPSHTHSVTDPGHGHRVEFIIGAGGPGSYEEIQNYSAGASYYTTNTTTTGITIGNTGSGTAMDFEVQYVDAIIATKD